MRNTDSETLQLRLLVEPAQADALIEFASSDGSDLSTLLQQSLRSLSGDAEGVTNLTDDQLRLVYSETCLFEAHQAPPGRLNINTISPKILYRLHPTNSRLVEDLLYLRVNNVGGIPSPVDFKQIPGFQDSMVVLLNGLYDTKSNVYSISCLGRAEGSGVEQEIIAIVDRSTLPVTILEYREQ